MWLTVPTGFGFVLTLVAGVYCRQTTLKGNTESTTIAYTKSTAAVSTATTSDLNNTGSTTSEELITYPPWEDKICGQSYPHVVNVTKENDTQVQFGDSPWSVTILSAKYPDDGVVCFGALIRPRAVLTSCSCLKRFTELVKSLKNGKPEETKDGKSLIIRTGNFNGHLTQSSAYPRQERNGTKLIVQNPDDDVMFDYAILILSKDVDFNKNVNTICLPTLDIEFEISNCWGISDSTQSGVNANTSITERFNCSKLRNCSPYIPNDNVTCSSCQIRGQPTKISVGTPIVCPMTSDPNRYVVAGISTGRGKSTEMFFTNIKEIADMIKAVS